MPPSPRLNRSLRPDPEAVAIEALSFLAGRPDDLARFLALSGLDPASLRRAAADRDFMLGLLDFLMDDEPLLLVFAETLDFRPEEVVKARQLLSDGNLS